MAKNEKGDEKKVDAPILFIIILFLFFVSFGILVFGFFKQSKVSKGGKDAVILEEGQRKEDSSLSEYFNEEFTKKNNFENGDSRESDPFREICEKSPNEDSPVVTSNTVCFY
ncbi:MAG: hypothetical protein UT24_C0004G0019 [Candidatus Woesebacteria bacterium GW2011_GWB1_39_12]|uniref:Uncharacterized protein n=2 Tax=Candidatus Woeseibacteriota TaxID=1752722 RepID=A0A0G0M545_9BACT|nr:MAG: hypothetical protein UT23_C0003G0024 [Candidatus Woesebacteria bacterium GW2011_GWA1_39_12]KKR01456.1 MAG: hypothetical protein UT24_C0004G0019 [Candidatus Woesebacteria bacterium GW2011_GWB1_39_12]